MVADREVKKEIKGQTRFVVTREFGGTQTMQQAFEQLIEKRRRNISQKRGVSRLFKPYFEKNIEINVAERREGE